MAQIFADNQEEIFFSRSHPDQKIIRAHPRDPRSKLVISRSSPLSGAEMQSETPTRGCHQDQ
jgi:hypothetical protein